LTRTRKIRSRSLDPTISRARSCKRRVRKSSGPPNHGKADHSGFSVEEQRAGGDRREKIPRQTRCLQITPRRPEIRLTINTIKATTNKRCTRLPAMWKLKPSSHIINKITKMVQSMEILSSPASEPGENESTGREEVRPSGPFCTREQREYSETPRRPRSSLYGKHLPCSRWTWNLPPPEVP